MSVDVTFVGRRSENETNDINYSTYLSGNFKAVILAILTVSKVGFLPRVGVALAGSRIDQIRLRIFSGTVRVKSIFDLPIRIYIYIYIAPVEFA